MCLQSQYNNPQGGLRSRPGTIPWPKDAFDRQQPTSLGWSRQRRQPVEVHSGWVTKQQLFCTVRSSQIRTFWVSVLRAQGARSRQP
jgi:hypothetical protein